MWILYIVFICLFVVSISLFFIIILSHIYSFMVVRCELLLSMVESCRRYVRLQQRLRRKYLEHLLLPFRCRRKEGDE